MQPSYREIKKAAIGSLKHRWPEAIAASLTLVSVSVLELLMQYVLMSVLRVDAVWSPVMPTVLPTARVAASIGITLFSTVFSLAVTFPLLLGIMRWFWLVTGGQDPHLIDIFWFFADGRRYFKSEFISFAVIWRLFIAAVICFVPYILANVLLDPAIYNYFGYAMPIWLQALRPVTKVLILTGTLSFLLWMSRYALIYTVLFSTPDLTAHKTVVASVKIIKGGKFRFIGFLISFFFWFLLGFTALPLLFIIPYFFASLSVFGREEYRLKSSRQEP